MAAVAKLTPDVDSIRGELDALQRERRVAEMRLRDLDAKRRMGPVAGRAGPPRDARDREAGRPGPGGSWISDRDRRAESGHERDRPHHRDHDRPHPWDVQKNSDGLRKGALRSSVTKAGDRRVEPNEGGNESTRPQKRGGGDRDEEVDDSEWKPMKRRAVEKAEEVAEPEDKELRDQPKVDEDEDDGADLPDRDDQQDGFYSRSKRAQLSSVVAVSRSSDQSDRRDRKRESKPDKNEKPKVPLSENTEIKQRNRKMFGALLGHLQKAKKDEEKILQTPTMQKRVEIEGKVEVMARESGEVLRRKLTEEMREERKKNLEQIRQVRQRQQTALHMLSIARVESQCKALSHHIRTSTVPEIFWRPVSIETAPQAVKDLLAKSKEAIETHSEAVRVRIEAERAADLEAEAAHAARTDAERSLVGYHEEEEMGGEHAEGGVDPRASATDAERAPRPREQVVEEVDEEEGPVEVEIAF